MDIFCYIVLFILWALFWSFSSVIIYRLRSWEWWILTWRSHCFKCKNLLHFIDLFPIFSFLLNFGKCRYCKSKIPFIYPILELSTWLLFMLVGIFITDMSLILALDIAEITKLIFWLIIAFITILYSFYDILFLEIHEWMMLTWVIIAFFALIINTFIFPIVPTISSLLVNDNSIIIPSIAIWLIAIWWLYVIMLKELKIIYDIIIIALCIWIIILFKYIFNIEVLSSIPVISWTIWALWIFIFFYLQITLSNWKALGWWDLRIWILVWLLLWISYSFVWMIMTYVIWSLISIIFLIIKQIQLKWKKIDSVVPFWPFIWLGFFTTVLFLNEIQRVIEIYFYAM